MLNPLKNLLSHFFMPESGHTSVDQAHSLQLAIAVLLVEVMRADSVASTAERDATVAALRTRFALNDEAVLQLVAQAEQTARSANDYFHFTSALNDQLPHVQKIKVVQWMWHIAYADGHLDANENHLISKIAGLLHVTHGEYIGAKLRAKESAAINP